MRFINLIGETVLRFVSMLWDLEILCEICKIHKPSNFNDICLKLAEYHTKSLKQLVLEIPLQCFIVHNLHIHTEI